MIALQGKSEGDPQLPPARVIFGIKAHCLSFAEVLESLVRLAATPGPHIVITLNTEMVMRAQKDARFRDIINGASLSIPDTAGLAWGFRVLGMPLKERIPGVDLVERFVAVAAQRSIRLFFLGATEGVAQKAADILCARYPGLSVVGTYAGSPRVEDEDRICGIVRAASPHVLLIAYGVPAQEFWLERNLPRLGVPVAINVGGTFDFVSGVTPRAPRWMRRAGLEWLFRLWLQPSRWRRMTVLPAFMLKVVAHRLVNGRMR
jgi:N-acetylglucosaminyldiphosphoundecaprenol N-acetyl-beta-D-mannosaminyltransferase